MSEEYDIKGANQKILGYSLSSVLNKLDRNIANYDYSAVKYIYDDMELANLNWKQRADFEYYLINYNVNKNADIATGVDSVVSILRTRDLFSGFKKGDTFKAIVLKIAAIITVLAIICIILSLVLLLLLKLFKAPPQFSRLLGMFLLYTMYLFIILTIIVIMSNKFTIQMASTEATTK